MGHGCVILNTLLEPKWETAFACAVENFLKLSEASGEKTGGFFCRFAFLLTLINKLHYQRNACGNMSCQLAREYSAPGLSDL